MKEGKGSLGVLPKFYMDGENVLDIKDKDDITKLKTVSGEESRWRRNRTERSLSLLQIHRKNNRTVKKVYKTTSDR